MTRVGIDELQNIADVFFSSGETLVIERHGKTVGFYIPVKAKKRNAASDTLEDFEHVINGILERTGMTENELLESEYLKS